ncbi:hypothetical protein UB40_12565 [Photobacterium kishitanii]|nr:hypothetical protein UB40_12565 [Photobacterium kishitanii]
MVFLAALFALTGCNGSGDDNSPPKVVSPLLPPLEAVSQVEPLIIQAITGTQKRIPIYQSVLPKAGQMLSIASVRSLSEMSTGSSCPDPQINGLELIYTQESQGVCNYEYTVTDGTTSTTGTLISFASLTGNKLPDISVSGTMATELTKPIALTADETLQVVTVLGSGSVRIEDNNIIFTPQTVGLSRVVYTISDDTAAPVTKKIGILNVTVSESADGNTPPKTPDVSFSSLPSESKIFTLPITDADIDSWGNSIDDPQLISVVSNDGATVTSATNTVDTAYFKNKSFTFSASVPGSYSVFYTAHDHRGGYSTGKATVSVVGNVGLIARDASFYRKSSNIPYDFKIDLRSYITASDISKVDFVGATFDAATNGSIDKNPAHIIAPTKANPILTYKYSGGNKSGLVAINYTINDEKNSATGRIFISIGDAYIPIITDVGATPIVDIGATVTATSSCANCIPAKTTYKWWFGNGVYSEKNSIVVPNGEAGESLVLVATPYNAAGVRGVSKSVTYSYPFRAATITVNRDKVQKGETITYAVNVTHLGRPVAGASVTVKGTSATNRQNGTQATVTAQIDGAPSVTKTTDSNGNAIFSITDNGPGVKTIINASIDGQSYGNKAVIFSVLTSPDVHSANFYGHMPNKINIGQGQYYRPPLAKESNGVGGLTWSENGETWGRFTQDDALAYCVNNVPMRTDLTNLYNAYPSGDIVKSKGWPIALRYMSKETEYYGDIVISLQDGSRDWSDNAHYTSCYVERSLDTTGVTFDILKEDGTYTNDKFLPSSSAMTEGALMFPGAGIRVNLPSYVDTSSIKADAPTGYRINIVGHTIEFTDMAPSVYTDQIITVMANNDTGGLSGIKLRVSAVRDYSYISAQEIIGRSHYVPSEVIRNTLEIDRGASYPDEFIQLYQHGLLIDSRLNKYEDINGSNYRLSMIRNKTGTDPLLVGLSPRDVPIKTLEFFIIPSTKSPQWLVDEIKKTANPNIIIDVEWNGKNYGITEDQNMSLASGYCDGVMGTVVGLYITAQFSWDDYPDNIAFKQPTPSTTNYISMTYFSEKVPFSTSLVLRRPLQGTQLFYPINVPRNQWLESARAVEEIMIDRAAAGEVIGNSSSTRRFQFLRVVSDDGNGFECYKDPGSNKVDPIGEILDGSTDTSFNPDSLFLALPMNREPLEIWFPRSLSYCSISLDGDKPHSNPACENSIAHIATLLNKRADKLNRWPVEIINEGTHVGTMELYRHPPGASWPSEELYAPIK